MAFGPLAARFRDAQGVAGNDELDGYAQALPAGALLLDCMCGTGRVLRPWLARGAKIHGVDASAAMLERCEAQLAARAQETSLFRQDVAELNLPFRYAGAFIAGGALQYLTDPRDVAAALARLRAHLVDPGVVVIDFEVPPLSQQKLAAPLVEVRTSAQEDGTRITLRSQTVWTPEARLATAEERYSQRRETELVAEEHALVRSTWYEPEEARALTEAAGFSRVEIGASPRVAAGADPAPETLRFAVIARA